MRGSRILDALLEPVKLEHFIEGAFAVSRWWCFVLQRLPSTPKCLQYEMYHLAKITDMALKILDMFDLLRKNYKNNV